MLIAYTKNANVAEVERTDLPDDPPLRPTSSRYFPTAAARAVRRRRSARHPLRREIIATRLVNQMVNLSGISFDHRMTEDTGASVVDVDAGVGRGPRGASTSPALWAEIDALDRAVAARHPARPVPRLPADGRAGVAVAPAPPPPADRHRRRRGRVPAGHRRAGGVARSRCSSGGWPTSSTRSRRRGWPPACPRSSPSGPACGRCCTPASTSSRSPTPTDATSPTWPRVDWAVFDALDLSWLWDGIGALPRSDRWQTQARSALRDDLLTALAELTDDGRRQRRRLASTRWLAANERAVGRAPGDVHRDPPRRELRPHDASVALRQLRNLAR